MAHPARRRLLPVAALMTVVAVVAAACGGGGGGGSAAPTASGSAQASASAGTPKVGGTLTFGEFSPPVSMDPILETGGGVTGLIELTQVYDTLMRYDYDTGKYDPGTALSATPNSDDTVWTIKLRPNVKFTDGTDYDADAVVFGLNRFRAGSPSMPCQQVVACPRPSTVNLAPYLQDVKALDKTTVQVTLTEPWASFPVVLAAEPGLIPSPTALKKCDANAPVSQCSYSTAPVGAGPFMLTAYHPGEVISMVRNPNYWGGQVYLDGINFITQNDGGGAKSYDAFKSGQTQISFLRDATTVAQAHADKTAGYADRAYVGSSVVVFNMGIAGTKPATADPRVRQAVAMAIDPNVVNQRAFNGNTQATTQLLPPSFKWYPDVPGPTLDPAAAKQLVNQAKAAGWNGDLRIVTSNVPAATNEALAIQAMLQNVGINATLVSADTATTTASYIKGDYDLWFGGYDVFADDWAEMALSAPLLSTSPSNRVGIKDPALDAGFKQLFAARTDAEKTAAWKIIATQVKEQRPILSLGTTEEFIVWDSKVHGVVPNVRVSVHLDKAWIG